MAGSNPKEAVDAFITPLRRSLLCVTEQVAFHKGGYHVGALHILNIGDPEPIQLRGTDVRLSVALHYRIVELGGERGPFKISTAAYYYTIHEAAGRDILAFHWHPQGRINFPHLHIGAGVGARREEFEKAHVPTGRVALESVIRLLIREFRAEPLRETWDVDLAEAESAFETWRTWG